MISLIGFAGRAGSGKSYAAKALARFAGYERVRLADPLKNMLRVIGLTDAEIEGELKEVPCPLLCGKTPRFAMQRLGSEFGRDMIGPTFWTDAWARQADAMLSAGRGVVVDDVRFPNEVEAVRLRGGRVIWIERAGLFPASNHVSEALTADACDLVIPNDGDERFAQAVAAAALDEEYA